MSEEILINVTPQETRIAMMENGVVQELGAAPGDSVERGAVVMLLEGEEVRAAVKSAQDQLAQAAEQATRAGAAGSI